MSIVVTAKFINGVLVPERTLPLAENEEVRLQVDRRQGERDVQHDLNAVREQARNRLEIDPALARSIGDDPAFNLENW